MTVISALQRLAGIQRLCRFIAAEHRVPWSPRATFGTHEVFLIRRTSVTVSYSVNVLPPGGGAEGVYRSIALSTPNTASGASRGGGWHPALLKMGWYKSCDLQLRRHGYRGEWLASEWGRVGYFSKRHGSADSLVSEVAILEAIRSEHRGLFEPPAKK